MHNKLHDIEETIMIDSLTQNAMMMQLSIVATIVFMHDGLGGAYDGKAPLVMGLWATCKGLLCNTFYQSLEFPP